jgi:hypothetical protein
MLALLAASLLTGFGGGQFAVEPLATTIDYSQTPQVLTLNGNDSLGETLGGYFLPNRNWQYVAEFGLRASLVSPNPYSVFYVELYSGDDLDLVGIYLGDTANLGEGGAIGNIILTQISNGPGTLSDVRGLQFSWAGGTGSPAQLQLHGMLNLNPPDPEITYFGFQQGSFVIQWTGAGAVPVNVQRIENLATQTWITIATGVTSGEYTDSAPPTKQAFYRVVVP